MVKNPNTDHLSLQDQNPQVGVIENVWGFHIDSSQVWFDSNNLFFFFCKMIYTMNENLK